MPKSTRKTWVYVRRKPIPPKVPDALKHEVETRSTPRWSQCSRRNTSSRHRRTRSSIISTISTPSGTTATSTSVRVHRLRPRCDLLLFFEQKFARLAYAGDGRFNLSYMRYTGQ